MTATASAPNRGLRKLRERAAAIAAAIAKEKEPWTGPVVRLGELSDADYRLVAGAPERARRLRSITLVRCANEWCRHWPPFGSRDAGRCLICHTPLEVTP